MPCNSRLTSAFFQVFEVRSILLWGFMRLAIFDLDHTLLPFDSDKSWNQFLIDAGVVDASYYQECNDQFYQDYLNESLDIRAYQRFATEVLRTHPLEQVIALRADYLAQIIIPGLLPKALACIADYRRKGFFTLIISATNEFIVEPIAILHGVDHFLGCRLEFIDGRYTGEMVGVPTYRDGKVEALQNWLTERHATAETIHFYSDSINDLPLLELADAAFAVDPDQKLRVIAEAHNWPVIEFTDG
jgi:HAD superfamily hydrolase (TIGR01490 family)